LNLAVVSSSHTQQRQKDVRELELFYKVRGWFFTRNLMKNIQNLQSV